MKKPMYRTILLLTSLAVLLVACGAPSASAETAGEIVNVLVIAGEDMGDTVFPIVPMILSFNLTKHTARYIYFYFETQIFAVAKNGDSVSIPMSLLPNCETPEIVKAYENTFGIPIDRYLIYKYTYGSYTPIVDVYDLLFPITVDIPEEILGTKQYTTINGNMKAIAKAMKRDYTAIQEAGPQELDAVGYLAYFSSIPDRVWESGDRFTMTMEDYKYWDMKNQAVLDGLRTIIGMMSPDTESAILQLLVKDQTTDITAEDIALWAAAGLNIAEESPYLSVPGFEGVALVTGDTGTLKGISKYQKDMFGYDNEAIKQQIQTFLYGD